MGGIRSGPEPSSVLWIPELLEPILLCLDMRTLLTSAQCVCWYWHDTINRSKAIQEALFFQPVKVHDPVHPVHNPLLQELFWPTGSETPFLDVPPFLPEKRNKAFHRKEASWRRMLIRQPPTSKLGIIEYEISREREILYHEVILQPVNYVLRMGLLHAMMKGGVIYPDTDLWAFRAPFCARGQELNLKDVRISLHQMALRNCDVAIFTYYFRLRFCIDPISQWFADLQGGYAGGSFSAKVAPIRSTGYRIALDSFARNNACN